MKWHYSEAKLDCWRNNDLSLASTLICKIHLAICPLCRKKLQNLKSSDNLLMQVRNLPKSITKE